MTAPSSLPARLHYVEDSPVPGLALAERRVDDPDATVVCVHGALDRGGSFGRVARRLERFDVVTYDRRGYQGSRALQPVSLENHVSDLIAVVKREAERGPVITLGHSFGGVVTFGAAAGGALISQIVNYESPYPWIVARRSAHPPLADPAEEAERFFRRVISPSAWERLSEEQRRSRRLDGPTLISDRAAIATDVAPYDVTTITTPVTYVHGDGVLAPYYRELAARLVEVLPQVRVVELEHANHAAHLKNPAELAEVVTESWDRSCASR